MKLVRHFTFLAASFFVSFHTIANASEFSENSFTVYCENSILMQPAERIKYKVQHNSTWSKVKVILLEGYPANSLPIYDIILPCQQEGTLFFCAANYKYPNNRILYKWVGEHFDYADPNISLSFINTQTNFTYYSLKCHE